MKTSKEWFILAPWGKIALLSWGNPEGDRVLLVHGREDSAATFIPLLDLLPGSFCYVGFDLPGNGKSDHFPTGLSAKRFDYVPVINFVVKHLDWSNFVCISHSMGSEISLLYNAIYADRITKLILLDPTPGIRALFSTDFQMCFHEMYVEYYDNYKKYNSSQKIYTKEEAMHAVMNARGLDRNSAEIVLSRNLIRIGEDKYKLAWDRRMKKAGVWNSHTFDEMVELLTRNIPPTLIFSVTNALPKMLGWDVDSKAENFINILKSIKNNVHYKVKGNHDVHLTNPERLAKYIMEFLDADFVKSKL